MRNGPRAIVSLGLLVVTVGGCAAGWGSRCCPPAGTAAPLEVRKPPITKFTLTNSSGRPVTPEARANTAVAEYPLTPLQKINGAVWEWNNSVMDALYVTTTLTSTSLPSPQTIRVDASPGYYLTSVTIRLTTFDPAVGAFLYTASKTEGVASP